MENTNKETPKESFNAKSTPAFKLKDKPGRGGIGFDLYKTFGFFPRKIIIQKVIGEHDKFILSAIIDEEDKMSQVSEKGGASQ